MSTPHPHQDVIDTVVETFRDLLHSPLSPVERAAERRRLAGVIAEYNILPEVQEALAARVVEVARARGEEG